MVMERKRDAREFFPRGRIRSTRVGATLDPSIFLHRAKFCLPASVPIFRTISCDGKRTFHIFLFEEKNDRDPLDGVK